MNIIAAVDKNWAIGYRNQLLVHIPADMRFFQEETMGKVVVMGRKTFESFPNGQALANRRNIVLTKRNRYGSPDVEIANGVEEALELLKNVPNEDIYVIGGGSVYRQMLPYCNIAHITKINYAYQADAYFPNLDEQEGWRIEYESEEQTYYNIEYAFYKYIRG